MENERHGALILKVLLRCSTLTGKLPLWNLFESLYYEGFLMLFSADLDQNMTLSFRETDYWHLLEHPPKGMEISILRAENSDRWDSDVVQRLESLARRHVDDSEGKFSLHVLPNAGHWVHVDNPKGLLDIVAPKIASLA